jgi:PAS domain S-box-containing protein
VTNPGDLEANSGLDVFPEHTLLRIVTEKAHVGLVVVNRQRRYEYANSTYAEILGLPSSDLAGQRLADVLGDVYETQVRPRLDRAFQGERIAYELRLLKSGTERYYSVNYEPTEVGGVIAFVAVVITDVTERVQIQSDSERFTAIVASSEDAILSTTLDGTVTSWNSAAERMFGYSATEMIGTSVTRLIPPDREGEEAQILDRIRRNESLRHFETVRRTRAGKLLDVSVTASPIRNSVGVIIGTSKVARDITERKMAEAALREEHDRAQRYLDSAEVILLALDIKGRITLINRYGCNLLESTPDELVGRDFIDACVPAAIRDATREKLATVQLGDDSVIENPVVTKSGEQRLIEWRTTFLRDQSGAIIGTFSSGLDITSRRSLEAQYHQAQKMEAVGRLAGGIAHDFNNLLTSILGYAQILLSELDPHDPRAADVIQIQNAGESAARLTRQLLAFSRKQVIEPTLLDLNHVIGGMGRLLDRLIGEDVQLITKLKDGFDRVNADAGQMEQIVLNLAVNARDAMPDGGIMTIETANVDLDENYASRHFAVKPGPYVSLTVTDTGTGMTPDVQARLFEPFFTTKEVGKGTGLGLATVHGIVTRNGGSVAVYSELGEGTSFTVYFPRAEDSDRPARLASRRRVERPATETILVVEDADGVRILADRMLTPLGYKVLLASNPHEAQQVFDANPSIDLLLTDVIMPGGSGRELAARLSARRPGLEVLYMSGYTEDAITQHGVLEAGIAFLHKPFTSEGLQRKIRELLDR